MKKVYKSLFCIALPLASLGVSANFSSVRAQAIQEDATLGNENSQVTRDVLIRGILSDRIDGGATRGKNLFHSFSEFNINEATRGAYFSNPTGIENIISRVTGSNASNILGTLGVLGNANLFFANPNGIVFGPNARLDVSGSFFASTSDSFIFDNGFEFSASNPQAPPLLTVNMPVGLRFRDNPGSITNRSTFRPTPSDTSSNPIGLQVPSGKTLALLGGDVDILDGGSVNSPGARIELGGLAEAGTIELENTGNSFKLNFPTNTLLSNVTLADDARVAVRASDSRGDIVVNTNIFTALRGGRLTNGTEGTVDGGDITVNSNEFNISGRGVSGLGAGIYQPVLSNASANTGKVIINTNSFNASSNGIINNQVFSGGVGNAGGIDISVKTGNLSLTNNAAINASTFGQGNAGRVNIQVENGDITLTNSSNILSNVGSNAIGKAGEINLTATGNFSLTNNAEISTSTFGEGDAARVNIQVENGDITLTNSSNIFSNVESNAIGKSGEINLTANNIFLRDGSQLQSSIKGSGDGAKISLIASGEVSFTGSSNVDSAGNQGFPSAIFTNVVTGGIGNAGEIDIKAGTLSLDGAQLSSRNSGQGDAGNIIIEAKDVSFNNFTRINVLGSDKGSITVNATNLSILGGSRLDAGVLADSAITNAQAGDIVINATDKVFIVGEDDTNTSVIANSLNQGAQGNAGNIIINTALFEGKGSIAIGSSTFGKGDAGKLSITATDRFSLEGSEESLSAIGSIVSSSALGNAKDIIINTSLLSLSNSQIFASTRGQGNASNIIINASKSASFNNSDIDSTTSANGNAGMVNILVKNGDITLTNASNIFSNVESDGLGNAGEINLNAKNIFLRDGSQLQSAIKGQGDGTKISLVASGEVSLTGSSPTGSVTSAIFSNVDTKGIGKGGDIEVKAGTLSLDGAELNTSTSGKGDAGKVTILIENGDITLTNSSNIFSNVEGNGIGNAGEINLTAKNIFLRDGSQLQSAIKGQGDGAKISLVASGEVSLTGSSPTGSFRSAIFSNVVVEGIGKGGDIEVKAGNLSLDGAELNTSTSGKGDAGKVTILIENGDITLTNLSNIFSNVESEGIGNAGEINLNAKNIFLRDASQLQSLIQGKGDGRQINLVASGEISLTGFSNIDAAGNPGSFSSGIFSIVDAGGRGIGGDINLTGRSLTATDGSQIGTSVVRARNNRPPGIGQAGNIDVNMTDFINISGFSETGFSSAFLASGERGTTATSSQAAGDITVTTRDFRIADGARIQASTANAGDGGKITINARNFSVINGAKVVTSTSNAGKAGDIKLNIADRITIAGVESNFNQRLAILEQAGEEVDTAKEEGPAGGIFASTFSGSTGDGGDIDIDPKTVEILDEARISADSRGTGKPGNINIVSDELLLLRRGGTISTNSTQDTDGGNITIDTGVLVALPNENSDITSNAVRGTGGRIDITAQGIFGIIPGDASTDFSDITANSEFGISGTVTINNPEVDPENGLVELPETVVDAENQIAQNPCQQGFGSSFVATGRGGLPPNPSLDLSTGAVRISLATPVASKTTASNTTASQPKSIPKAKKFVPAQGWVFNSKGQVVLTAYDPNSTGVQRTSHKGLCRAQ